MSVSVLGEQMARGVFRTIYFDGQAVIDVTYKGSTYTGLVKHDDGNDTYSYGITGGAFGIRVTPDAAYLYTEEPGTFEIVITVN